MKHTASILLLGLLGWTKGRCGEVADEVVAASYNIRTWMTDEGLPHNVVTHIIQDGTGYIWLATGGGLARFDGRQFRTIALPPEMRQRGYNIRGVAEETAGSLLLLLPNGTVVRMEQGVFSVHPITAFLNEKTPTDLFVEPGGAVWVGTEDGALFRWQNGQAATFGKADGIDRRAPAFSFATDRQGRTWVASGSFLGYYRDGMLVPLDRRLGKKLMIALARSGGIWILADSRLLEMDDNRLREVPDFLPELPGTAMPRQIFEDHSNTLWICTRRQGLFRYAHGECRHVDSPCDSALVIAEDREDDIWVGTEGGGVSMLRQKFFSVYDGNAGSTQKVSSALCADATGNVWSANREDGVACYREGGFQSVDGTHLKANTLCLDPEGRLWVGASDGLYHLARDPCLPSEKISGVAGGIRTLFCTRNGDVWFGSHAGALGYVHQGRCRLFSADDGFRPERITAIVEDRTGAVWTGSDAGVLRRFAEGKLVRVDLPAEIPAAPVHALHVDASGLLWIGTSDGLILFREERFKRFAEADGLPDALIFQIQEDDFGNFWLGSRHGLFRVSSSQLLARAKGGPGKISTLTLGKEDGVPSISLLVGGQPLSCKDANGRLWFTTMQGVVSLDPSKISTASVRPPVVVEETLIDGQALAEKGGLRIPSGKHHLEFKFAVLSYAATEKIRLRHQLEGVDPGWVETGGTRAASYSSLPPGKYRLRVVADQGDDSQSSGEAALGFYVVPAWWQTLWARLGAGLTLMGAMTWGIRRYSHWHLQHQFGRLKKAHALEKERARIARDLHDELGGSLTRIAFGVDQLRRRPADPEFHSLLEQLSQRVRRHASDLQRVVWVESSKNDSLDRVVLFIGRFAQDYFRDSAVTCLLRHSAGIPSDPIQPEVQHNLIATAKEAFNNVLKHAKATNVVIEARFSPPTFELMIKDNGVGFIAGAGASDDHNGLMNMYARIAEIGGILEIRSKPGKGTTILIRWTYGARLKKT